MLGELTFNVGIQRTSPRLEWEPKVIWIWQSDCKSDPSGSGSSPQGPTINNKRVVKVKLLRIIGSNPIPRTLRS